MLIFASNLYRAILDIVLRLIMILLLICVFLVYPRTHHSDLAYGSFSDYMYLSLSFYCFHDKCVMIVFENLT